MHRKLVLISTILIVLILLMAMTPAVALALERNGNGPWGFYAAPGGKCEGKHPAPPSLPEPCGPFLD